MPLHRFEDLDSRQERESQIESAVRVAERNIRIGRKVVYHLRARLRKHAVQFGAIEDVRLVEVELVVAPKMANVRFPAEIEVVEAPDFIAARHQLVAEMAADETRAARYQHTHVVLSLSHAYRLAAIALYFSIERSMTASMLI